MQEVNPEETTRAYAFRMWMKAPMPMVTLIKTLDVTRLRRISRRHGLKFNMLLCWCIGKAATQVREFHILPVGDRLIRYDKIAVNTIVANRAGELSSCDIPYSDDLPSFNSDYLRLTRQAARTCENHDIADSMVIGTSALAQYDIDGAVGMYSGIYNPQNETCDVCRTKRAKNKTKRFSFSKRSVPTKSFFTTPFVGTDFI